MPRRAARSGAEREGKCVKTRILFAFVETSLDRVGSVTSCGDLWRFTRTEPERGWWWWGGVTVIDHFLKFLNCIKTQKRKLYRLLPDLEENSL